MMNAVGKWLENNKTPGRKVVTHFTQFEFQFVHLNDNR